MTGVRVVVLTSDRYIWCLRPFAYLFNTYWSSLQPVNVYGFSPPGFGIPQNFSFTSIARENYPADRWSDQLIQALNRFDDELFVLLLEDYLLCRTVDHQGIATLVDYMVEHPNIVRLDLTADRLYVMGMHDVEPYGHYDIIECQKDAPYQMSLQAAIWRKSLLRNLLVNGKSAWEVEIHSDMTNTPYRVVGTRQYPVRYANAVLKGKVVAGEIERIQEPHREVVEKLIPSNLEWTEKYG